MTEILETAVIESVKSDCEVVHYDVEVHGEMHRLRWFIVLKPIAFL